MKLITAEILAAAPPLYSQDSKAAKDVRIVAKFFNPCGRSTYYMTEYDPDDGLGFGYVIGELGPDCDELGLFSIPEMEAIELPFGLRFERDIHYPCNVHTLDEVLPGVRTQRQETGTITVVTASSLARKP
jgi:hypothetical protein